MRKFLYFYIIKMNDNIDEETVDISDMSVYKPSGSGLSITDLVKEKQVQENTTNVSQDKSNYTNIKDLAEDVNKSLLELDKIERRPKQIIKNRPKMVRKMPQKNYMKTVMNFLLLVTIYVILSQTFVIDTVSKFVYQLKPTDKGIRFSGIVIYGVILASLYMSSSYYLSHRWMNS